MDLPIQQQTEEILEYLEDKLDVGLSPSLIKKKQTIIDNLSKRANNNEAKANLYLSEAYIMFFKGEPSKARKYVDAADSTAGVKDWLKSKKLLNRLDDYQKTSAPTKHSFPDGSDQVKNQISIDEDDPKIKKDIVSYKEGGKAAIAVAWLLILSHCLLVGIFGKDIYEPGAVLALWLLIILPYSIYLFVSGFYIKSRNNHITKNLLLLNGFAIILLSWGIIPIIASIMSFVGYSKYKKLERTKKIPPDSNKWLPSLWIVIIYVVFSMVYTLYLVNNRAIYYNGSALTLESNIWTEADKTSIKEGCLSEVSAEYAKLGYPESTATNTCACYSHQITVMYKNSNDFNRNYTQANLDQAARNCAISNGVNFQ